MFDTCLIRDWYVIHAWFMRASCVIHAWFMRDSCVIDLWSLREVCVIDTWFIRDWYGCTLPTFIADGYVTTKHPPNTDNIKKGISRSSTITCSYLMCLFDWYSSPLFLMNVLFFYLVAPWHAHSCDTGITQRPLHFWCVPGKKPALTVGSRCNSKLFKNQVFFFLLFFCFFCCFLLFFILC